MPKQKKKKVAIKNNKLKILKTVKRSRVLAKKQKKHIMKSKTSRKKRESAPKLKKRSIARKKIVLKETFHHNKKRQAVKPKNIEFPTESLFKAKIKVVGIGGGGGSIVSEMGKSLEKVTFVIADTDIRALKNKAGIKYFWFGQDLTHGLGTGVNVDLARQAAESAKEKIGAIFKDQDIVIFVASLGGGLGSGATQVFADAAKEFGGITFGIFTMPFKFEGKNKFRIAQNALKSLQKSLNVSLVIPNEKIFKIIDEATPITNAFSTVNKSLIESLESLIDLIYNPGIINIDFADLRTILSGRGNSAFLNNVEESGKDKVEKICEKIFRNPLLQNNSFETKKILFNIAGGENLSMFEVEKISSHIASMNQKAKIIFGISKNTKLKNKIKTTILMTGNLPGVRVEEESSVNETEPATADQVEKNKKVVKIHKKPQVAIAKKENIPSTPIGAKKTKSQKKASAHTGKKPAVPKKKEGKPVSFIPVFETAVPALESKDSPIIPVLEQTRMDAIKVGLAPEKTSLGGSNKKTIRRSGLEIRKAEELQEKKRLAQEKEWEIPAFLRKIKFRS